MKGRGRPKKTLAGLVADRSFLARRHAELLADAPVADPTLAALQALYRQAGDDRQRRRVALQFEKVCRVSSVPRVVPERDVAPDVEPAVELEEPVEAAETQLEMMRRVWGSALPYVEGGWDPAVGRSPHDWWPGKLSGSPPNTWPSIGEPSERPSEPG